MWISSSTIIFIILLLTFCKSYNDTETEFLYFIKKFKKNYLPGQSEYKIRFEIFKESLKRHAFLNNKRTHSSSAWFGINQFSDLTPEEFKKNYLSYGAFRYSSGYKNPYKFSKISSLYIPDRVDWREKNIITPVRDQKKCGACWAFSTIASIESMVALKTNVLKELSVQQVVDCAVYGNRGCRGGDTCEALQWMNESQVLLVPEESYPFYYDTGSCKLLNITSGVQITNYTCNYFVDHENLMKQLLYMHGPLTVAVDAETWQDYLGGIILFHCYNLTNHAVQIVGYDTSGEIPYYIVRNSWGPIFGINGYLYIRIGANLCGIAQEVSTVSV